MRVYNGVPLSWETSKSFRVQGLAVFFRANIHNPASNFDGSDGEMWGGGGGGEIKWTTIVTTSKYIPYITHYSSFHFLFHYPGIAPVIYS